MPTRRFEKYHTYNLLDPKRKVGNMFTIQKNILQTEDDIIQYGQSTYEKEFYNLLNNYKAIVSYPNILNPYCVF